MPRTVEFKAIEPKDLVQEDYLILLIGGAGFGRTNFLNRLLDVDGQSSDSRRSSSKKTVAYRVSVSSELGLDLTHFVIAKIPGVGLEDVDVDRAIEPWLSRFMTAHIAGVFYVYNIRTRNSGILNPANEWANAFILKKLSQTAAAKSLFLVQTYCDEHPGENESTKGAVMKALASFIPNDEVYNDKAIRFENTHDSAWNAVKTALLRYDNEIRGSHQADIISAVRRPHRTPTFQEFCKFTAEQHSKPHADDVVIVAMGSTGSGMSSFISTVVTGEVPQDDGGLTSQTTEVTTTRFVPPAGLEGPQPSAIVFVDTPGFDRAGLELSDRKILEIVAAWLKEQFKGDIPLAGLLYFRRINDPRMTSTDIQNLEIFSGLCGKKIMNRVVFVTTMWDQAEPTEGQFVKNFTQLSQTYWKSCLKLGAGVVKYRQRSRGDAFEVIKPLIDTMNSNAATTIQEHLYRGSVRLQRQTIGPKERSLAATSAGQAVYSKLSKVIKVEEKILQELARDDPLSDKVGQQGERLEGMKKDKRVLKVPLIEKVGPKQWLR